MQTSITKLTDENAKVNRELTSANSRNSQLQADLDAAKNKSGNKGLIVCLAIVTIILIIALFIK